MAIDNRQPDILIKNPETVSLSLQQTSKGFWYVDQLKVTMVSVEDVLPKIDKLITETLKRLHQLNEGSCDAL